MNESPSVSRPDLREPFLFSIWLGQGVTWVGKSMFVFLCWPCMVPNQRQLSIVVSDWRSYLGSPFSHLQLWDLVFVSCCVSATILYVSFIFLGVHLNKFKMYAYHAAPRSNPSLNDRDTVSGGKQTEPGFPLGF